jgi:carbonic anhydrase
VGAAGATNGPERRGVIRRPQQCFPSQIAAKEAPMTAVEDLVDRNKLRSGTGPGALAGRPSLQVAVVACMDARLDPVQLLGLRPGEAHVIRNAGGVVTDDVIRSLAVSQRKLGTTEVMLLHHTNCGMATFTDEDFCSELQEATGLRPTWAVGTFRNTEADVRQSVEQVRRSPFLANTTAVRGFVVDVETGDLAEVAPSQP